MSAAMRELGERSIAVVFRKDWNYIERFCLVAMRAEATPVPIPNTTVKIRAADGTMLETAWESRRLPDILYKTCFACDEHPGRDS